MILVDWFQSIERGGMRWGYIAPELIQYHRLKTPMNIAMRHRKVVYIRPRPRRLTQRLHKSNRTIVFGSYRDRPLDVA